MSSGIFATYRKGENRVTASILAVWRSLSLPRTERLIAALLEDADFRLVTFKNQIVAKGQRSVPDAEVIASVRILIETKLDRNAVDEDQLREHLSHLDAAASNQLLLVLTPDEIHPPAVDRLNDRRVTWASFAALDQAIDGLLGDKTEVISEREAFLLRELQQVMVTEGLLRSPDDTLIVPARHAWPEYCQLGAYVCQPDRAFQPTQYLGFYEGGQIHQVVPRIREVRDRVAFVPGQHAGEVGRVVEAFVSAGLRPPGSDHKIFLLSRKGDSDTLYLAHPIPNDLRSEAGRLTAFTQSQRYVRSERLKTATSTSDLIAFGPEASGQGNARDLRKWGV
jgi:hypothetical protein